MRSKESKESGVKQGYLRRYLWPREHSFTRNLWYYAGVLVLSAVLTHSTYDVVGYDKAVEKWNLGETNKRPITGDYIHNSLSGILKELID